LGIAGGEVVIRLELSGDLEPRIVANSVQRARIQVTQDATEDGRFSRAIKSLARGN